MTISWTDAAIEAAFDEAMECFDDAMMENHQDQIRRAMRAALDAAVRAQGCPKLPDCKTYADRAYADGRADALEEAAMVAGECHFDEDDPKNDDRDRAYAQARRHAAADIRALKDAKP